MRIASPVRSHSLPLLGLSAKWPACQRRSPALSARLLAAMLCQRSSAAVCQAMEVGGLLWVLCVQLLAACPSVSP